MTANRYQPRITAQQDQSFYAMIVRVDSDGSENVIRGFKCRTFATVKAAERATAKHIERFCA